jgi:hypothetical protein
VLYQTNHRSCDPNVGLGIAVIFHDCLEEILSNRTFDIESALNDEEKDVLRLPTPPHGWYLSSTINYVNHMEVRNNGLNMLEASSFFRSRFNLSGQCLFPAWGTCQHSGSAQETFPLTLHQRQPSHPVPPSFSMSLEQPLMDFMH